MTIGIEFTVYDGPSPYQQEGEGTTPSPSIDSTAEFKFADDVPLFDNVTYHNLDGAPGDDGITDSTSKGLIDEDWLQTGANDKGADGTSNAGANDDTHGSFYVNGKININFGADGPAQTDNPKDEGREQACLRARHRRLCAGRDLPLRRGHAELWRPDSLRARGQ
jgi:hypothetical protein